MSGKRLLWEDSSHLWGGTSKRRSSALVSQGEWDCLSFAEAVCMNATACFFHKLILNKSSSHLIILQSLSPQPFTQAFWSVCVCAEKRVTFNFLIWDECLWETQGRDLGTTLLANSDLSLWQCECVKERDREKWGGKTSRFSLRHSQVGFFQIHNSWYFFLGVSQRIRMLFICDRTVSAWGLTHGSVQRTFRLQTHSQPRVSRFNAPFRGKIT